MSSPDNVNVSASQHENRTYIKNVEKEVFCPTHHICIHQTAAMINLGGSNNWYAM